MGAEATAQHDRKHFLSPVEPRWCPGCGCYPILKGVTDVFSDIGVERENIAVISGIGCSSRFPYYVSSYGFHTIHGRAPTVAMGTKLANPALSTWVVTGDGDCLSIGGNHFIHLMRRNPNINVLLFNNEIYGLTKGQTSPTSVQGRVTKTTPMGSLEEPLRPTPVAISAGATFVARVLDADLKSMKEIFKAAHEHNGISFVEIYFNCVIFNNNAFEPYTNKKSRPDNTCQLIAGQPIIWGANDEKGLILEGLKFKVVNVADVKKKQLVVHDPEDSQLAYMLASMDGIHLPKALGIIKQTKAPEYSQAVYTQINKASEKLNDPQLDKLFKGNDSWEVRT